jgi:hypothetical protein
VSSPSRETQLDIPLLKRKCARVRRNLAATSGATIDAGLGKKEVALGERKRAMELMPVEKDSINGQRMQIYFAIIAAWVGEKDLALQQLAIADPTPGHLSSPLTVR